MKIQENSMKYVKSNLLLNKIYVALKQCINSTEYKRKVIVVLLIIKKT